MPESYMKLLTGSTQYQNLEKALGDFSPMKKNYMLFYMNQKEEL